MAKRAWVQFLPNSIAWVQFLPNSIGVHWALFFFFFLVNECFCFSNLWVRRKMIHHLKSNDFVDVQLSLMLDQKFFQFNYDKGFSVTLRMRLGIPYPHHIRPSKNSSSWSKQVHSFRDETKEILNLQWQHSVRSACILKVDPCGTHKTRVHKRIVALQRWLRYVHSFFPHL